MVPLELKRDRMSTDDEADSFELIPIRSALSGELYSQWLDNHLHGEMKYMEQNREKRLHPQDAFPQFQSVLVVTQSYYPHPAPQDQPFPSLKIALYAQGEDYHHWFRKKLQDQIESLKLQHPNEQFMAFTDAVPLLERDLAVQAQLGWVGKNTCLIHPKKGSLFFIGEILTTLTADKKSIEPMHDYCGKCTACVDACPTQALSRDQRMLDANKCISHWNIESRNNPPLELRRKMGDWFFGCDICQTVCPWNVKLHEFKQKPSHNESSRAELIHDLRTILTSSRKQLERITRGTPLSRAGGRGLQRNALVVSANRKLSELITVIKPFTQDPHLAELAKWSLEQLADEGSSHLS